MYILLRFHDGKKVKRAKTETNFCFMVHLVKDVNIFGCDIMTEFASIPASFFSFGLCIISAYKPLHNI